MSTIDQNSQNSLSAILDKLGVNRSDEKKQADKSALGQEDFLKLMTTQLQNQDPFAPMENGEFIAQMAQFSTVTGITEMGETLKDMSSQLSEFRLATATNLLGSSVLIPGNTSRPDENGQIHGVVDLPSASTATSITISDLNGEVIDTIELGAQASGLVGFTWDNVPQDIIDENAAARLDAYADTGSGREAVSSSVFAEVLAASTGGASGVRLDVRDYGEIDAAEVVKFRK